VTATQLKDDIVSRDARIATEVMFSYLRPNRRTPSNPTSPNPDTWDEQSPPRISPQTFENVRSLDQDFGRPRAAIEARRPAGTRMPTPPPPTEVSTFDPHKKRLNLLNPMSLLARRRTSQAVPHLAPIPVQDDPRIRGTRVHDFSAPRPRRNVSSNDTDSKDTWSGGHTPVFTEDFEGFGTQVADLPPTRPPPAPPVPPKENEKHITLAHPPRISSITRLEDIPKPRPRNVSELSTKDLPKPRSRNVSEVSTKDLSGLPRHMQSTSSRFSFDMLGAASQEKLLEDRHRQKALEKKSTSPEPEAYEDNYDFDDDGLEERIPGVNADYDDDYDDYEEEIPGQGESGFTFHSLGIFVDPSPLHAPIDTPRDANGNVIGFALSKESPGFVNPHSSEHTPVIIPAEAQSPSINTPVSGGLGLQGIDFGLEKYPNKADEDDLYFDDGIIDQGDDTEGGDFDESIFDNEDTDEYGRPVRSLSSLPTLYSPPYVQTGKGKNIDRNSQEPQSAISSTFEDAQPETMEILLQPAASLTQDSLSAYQSALAAAAHNAAANGRFRRDSSPVINFDERPNLSPEMTSGLDDYENDDFDYDDALEDDDIIAAANAEALANDSDGFYGQEFGFYSAPAGEAKYANGGFFGPRDIVIRTKSGRNIPREPNLTPITERSEYSNRNSMMSLPLSGHLGVSSPGLAQLMGDYDEENMSISALLKMRRGWGGSQVSLRSSNGGSPMSTAGDDPQSHTFWSPVSGLRRNSGFSIGVGSGVASEQSSAPASPTLTLANMGQIDSSHSQSQSQTPSPSTAMLSSLSARPLSPTTKGFGMVSDAGENGFGKQGRSHRHTGSADSISYMKEEDPVTGERWVLERRRTAESGEVEILGREILGGRI
jgi:hypothetical protein